MNEYGSKFRPGDRVLFAGHGLACKRVATVRIVGRHGHTIEFDEPLNGSGSTLYVAFESELQPLPRRAASFDPEMAPFAVGDRVLWQTMWLQGKRSATVRVVHGPRTYILDLDKPLPAPHGSTRAVAFDNELEAFDESIRLLACLDPAFERFMQRVMTPQVEKR